MKSHITSALVAASVVAGALIAYADTRPGWDDTGITAGGLFIASAALSFARPRLALIIGIAVGGWIPLLEFSQNPASILALGIALVGALSGAGLRAVIPNVAA